MAFRRHPIMAILIALAIVLLGTGKASASTLPLFSGPALSDTELAEARGGFSLPGGMEIDFAVDITTSVNGLQILETQFALAGDSISQRVTSTVDLIEVSLPGSANVTDKVQDTEAVAKTGAIPVATTAPPNVGAAVPTELPSANVVSGQADVVSVPPEIVSARAEIEGLLVEHSIGQQIASTIINTVDNRVIDHQVNISISIGNVKPMSLGSVPFRVERLAFDAMIWRGS